MNYIINRATVEMKLRRVIYCNARPADPTGRQPSKTGSR